MIPKNFFDNLGTTKEKDAFLNKIRTTSNYNDIVKLLSRMISNDIESTRMVSNDIESKVHDIIFYQQLASKISLEQLEKLPGSIQKFMETQKLEYSLSEKDIQDIFIAAIDDVTNRSFEISQQPINSSYK